MLRDGPTDAAKKAKWVSAIIDEIPKDSWDNDLEYNVNGGSFELRSSGLDQQMNTDDDITVEGSGTVEHVPHYCHLRGVPLADTLVKGGGIKKHAVQILHLDPLPPRVPLLKS